MSDHNEDDPMLVCRNPGCSQARRDEFDGCCSTMCALENEAVAASARDPRRHAEQEADSEAGR